MGTETVPVILEDGQTIRIRATSLGGEQDAGVMDQFSFNEITASIEKIALNLEKSLEKVQPTKASIEFGIEVGIESGQLVTLIAKGTATSNLKITIEWSKKPGGQADGSKQP